MLVLSAASAGTRIVTPYRHRSRSDRGERVAHLRNGRPIVLRAENRGARDKSIGPRARDSRDVPGVHTAVHFQHDRAPGFVDFPARVTQFFQGVGDEFLPAEAWI